MTTVIRDAVEAVLVAGVKAWGLETSADRARQGVRCFQDDGELLAVAASLGVPGNVVSSLPGLLEEHPGILDGEQAHRAFRHVFQERMENMTRETSGALEALQPLFRDEVDPDYFATVLSTLAFLAMRGLCAESDEVCLKLGYSATNLGEAVTAYTNAVSGGDPELVAKVQAHVFATRSGQMISRVLGRKARQIFTMLVAGNTSALARVLADMCSEVIEEVRSDHD